MIMKTSGRCARQVATATYPKMIIDMSKIRCKPNGINSLCEDDHFLDFFPPTVLLAA
jgi:hypothetical protein